MNPNSRPDLNKRAAYIEAVEYLRNQNCEVLITGRHLKKSKNMTLTEREDIIIEGFKKGLTQKEIAAQLDMHDSCLRLFINTRIKLKEKHERGEAVIKPRKVYEGVRYDLNKRAAYIEAVEYLRAQNREDLVTNQYLKKTKDITLTERENIIIEGFQRKFTTKFIADRLAMTPSCLIRFINSRIKLKEKHERFQHIRNGITAAVC